MSTSVLADQAAPSLVFANEFLAEVDLMGLDHLLQPTPYRSGSHPETAAGLALKLASIDQPAAVTLAMMISLHRTTPTLVRGTDGRHYFWIG